MSPVAWHRASGDIRSFAWSPGGEALIYAARCKPTVEGDSSHRLVRLAVASGDMSCVAELPGEPRLLTWSPQGEILAFVMQTPHPEPQPVVMPEGATDRWARRARYIEERFYRLEGAGLIGHSDGLFVLHLSNGDVSNCDVRRLPGVELRGGGLMPATIAWRPDGSELLFASNLEADWQATQEHSDIHAIEPSSGG